MGYTRDGRTTSHKPSTPFPQNLTLTKNHTVDPSKTQRVLDRGYMCVVGQLLWATRGAFPECHNRHYRREKGRGHGQPETEQRVLVVVGGKAAGGAGLGSGAERGKTKKDADKV